MNGTDDLLRAVSRSFYLSMRFLPGPMREPVSLGYLLARLSDTVADAPGVALATRLEGLEKFRTAIRDVRADWGADFALPDSHRHEGERELVSRADELLAALAATDPACRDHLQEVILTIVHGQTWDATAFADTMAPCRDAADLLRYTYWVAGCVGEFWTKVGFTTLGEHFADPDEASAMLVRGKQLGQALQLTNILRDLHEDLPAARCYLPADELQAAGWDGKSSIGPELLKPAFARWIGLCEEYLGETDAYAAPVHDRRARFCTRLPMLLAGKTLSRLREAGVAEVCRKKIKIPRSEVWKSMARCWFG